MRKFDRRFSVRFAFVAATICATMWSGESFAQSRNRISLFPRRNSSPEAPAQPPSGPNFGSAPSEESFQERLDRAIAITSKRCLTANAHSPWQIFHSILALKKGCQLRLGDEKVNAIEWLSTTEPKFDGKPWMLLTQHGAKFHPYTQKFYFEGHPGQFLALLSQSNLPLDHQFKVQGKVVTLNDVINNTKKEVNTAEEVTWVLWGLQHYLKSDAVWVNQKNETWSIELLVKMETDAAVVGAPCGGNHRLFALTRARDKYLQNGGTLRGVWFEADQKIRRHIDLARSLQNEDGSFSSSWYQGRNRTNDVNERFNTTGHIMEFLSISLPKERLNEPWVKNAVWKLSSELIYHQNSQIDAGPLFHTLDAMILYRDRIRPVTAAPQIATSTPESPLDSALKTTPEPTAISESSKAIPGAKSDSNIPSDVNTQDAIPLAKDMRDYDAKHHSDKLGDRNLLNSDTGPSTRKLTPPTKNPSKIDPSQIPDIGRPAPSPKLNDERLTLPRNVTREITPNAAPALLPETFARPLLESEPSKESPKSCASPDIVPKDSQWKPTSPERSGKVPQPENSDAPISATEEEEEPASALEPSNI